MLDPEYKFGPKIIRTLIGQNKNDFLESDQNLRF